MHTFMHAHETRCKVGQGRESGERGGQGIGEVEGGVDVHEGDGGGLAGFEGEGERLGRGDLQPREGCVLHAVW